VISPLVWQDEEEEMVALGNIAQLDNAKVRIIISR
jgi:hypothetical protein